jgi:hypothetical protein
MNHTDGPSAANSKTESSKGTASSQRCADPCATLGDDGHSKACAATCLACVSSCNACCGG